MLQPLSVDPAPQIRSAHLPRFDRGCAMSVLSIAVWDFNNNVTMLTRL